MRAPLASRCAAAGIFVLAAALAGCLMGPNYQRPAVAVPPAYRAPGAAAASAPAPGLGAEKWTQLYPDPVLRKLIQTALTRNYDVRIAATRVLEAQEQAGITRAAEFPAAAVEAGVVSERNPQTARNLTAYSTGFGHLNLDVIWNLDFWGRYRRATEAARDQWLATQWGQRAVVSSVVAQVAAGYFQLRQLDDALAIAQQAVAARQDSLRLTQVLAKYGSASELDVSQAQELLAQAGATVPDVQRRIAQQEDLLSTLIGDNPESIPRGAPLAAQPNPPAVPAGLPSSLLERRPDVRQAEAELMAANAEIGVARASLFPNISLTGSGGAESYALNRLFTASGKQWNLAANLVQPVFAAGSLRAGVRLSEAQKQQMLLSYQQTLQQAFRQVSDALVELRRDHETRAQQQQLAAAAAKAEQLSNILYKNGGGSYLQVLVAETNSFNAQLALSQAELNERLALVELYNALGGGWQ
ncbi:MAG TPA: efflux transporter outer membrane subunit [Terriglobales bacterium]|nr:efflux transporter outer membrane subunit [Terriglobales bacterium]